MLRRERSVLGLFFGGLLAYVIDCFFLFLQALLNVPSSRKRLLSLCSQWERKLSRTFEFGQSGRDEKTPRFLVKRSKAKTDMLILGISYDLKDGVATFRRLLSLPARPELMVSPAKQAR